MNTIRSIFNVFSKTVFEDIVYLETGIMNTVVMSPREGKYVIMIDTSQCVDGDNVVVLIDVFLGGYWKTFQRLVIENYQTEPAYILYLDHVDGIRIRARQMLGVGRSLFIKVRRCRS